MNRFLKLLGPVVILAAVIAAALSTVMGTADSNSHASAAVPAAAVSAATRDSLFISEHFEQQKRNAQAEDLPAQF
ncbi:MAG TPA: hypothetical protein VKD22_02060 [Ramlibacter sp.]|nr:hypothetical protein [Ramlibacter sp.]